MYASKLRMMLAFCFAVIDLILYLPSAVMNWNTPVSALEPMAALNNFN